MKFAFCHMPILRLLVGLSISQKQFKQAQQSAIQLFKLEHSPMAALVIFQAHVAQHKGLWRVIALIVFGLYLVSINVHSPIAILAFIPLFGYLGIFAFLLYQAGQRWLSLSFLVLMVLLSWGYWDFQTKEAQPIPSSGSSAPFLQTGTYVDRLGETAAKAVIIKVENHNWSQVSVFSIPGGYKIEDILHLDLRVTNHYTETIIVQCQLRDSIGAFTDPTVQTSFNHFIQPERTWQGEMEFSILKTDNALYLNCGKWFDVRVQ